MVKAFTVKQASASGCASRQIVSSLASRMELWEGYVFCCRARAGGRGDPPLRRNCTIVYKYKAKQKVTKCKVKQKVAKYKAKQKIA